MRWAERTGLSCELGGAATVGPGTRACFLILAHQRLWTMRFSLIVRSLGDAWESGFSICEAGWGWVGIRLQKRVD